MVNHRADLSHGEISEQNRSIGGVVSLPIETESRLGRASEVALGAVGSSKDINGTTGRTHKKPGSRPPRNCFVRVRTTASEGTDRPRISTDKLKGVHAISRHGEECPFSRRSSESPRWSLSLSSW